MFQEKAHQTAQHKEKEKKKNSYKQTWNNTEFWVSHWYFTSPTRSTQLLTPWGTGTALAIINTTYLGGLAYSKGTDFGRREQKVSRVGAAATSSVRSFQSLIALGKKENFL